MLTAQSFNWLVLSIPLNAAMFHADGADFTHDELHAIADEAVRVFLAADGPDRTGVPELARRSHRPGRSFPGTVHEACLC